VVTARWLVCGLLIVSSSCASTRGGDTERVTALNNCDLDIRPKGDRREAQVYWNAYDADADTFAVKFEVRVLADNALVVGTYDADPYKITYIPLRADYANSVTFSFAAKDGSLTLYIDNGKQQIHMSNYPYAGQFDPHGAHYQPARKEKKLDAKRRQTRITLQSFGIHPAFTISDA